MDAAPDSQAAAPARGPLDGLMGMAVDGIAAYAADAVRDGLSRLISGGPKAEEDEGKTPSSKGTGATLLLAVAVAAVVTMLLVRRSTSSSGK